MSRGELVLKYCLGSGIEIGPGHAPMSLSPGVSVTYVDYLSIMELQKVYKTPNKGTALDLGHVIDNAEKLTTFPETSQDFVIASHVFEHCQDPIGTLKNWIRVLKPGGYLWMAIPEKTQTFDKKRKVTTFEHLQLDHLGGPELSAADHYREYFALVDGNKGEELHTRVKHALANKVNIHFHVWDEPAQIEMFNKFKQYVQYELVAGIRNGAEMIWLLKK